MSLYRCADERERNSYFSYPRYPGIQSSQQWPNRRHDENQRHVHEVQGSVEIAEAEEDPHNHRFATVTGQAIPIGKGDHIHEVKFRTDFYEDHFHEFSGKTGGMIKVGDRHVHFLESVTTVNDGHRHKFRLSTFIDNPIGEEDC